MFSIFTISIIIISLISSSSISAGQFADNDSLTLRILHTNDMHSRFDQTSQFSSICGEKDAKANNCYGGMARLATVIRQARSNSTWNSPVFFLNAGDTFYGSLLYTYYKRAIVTRFLNILKPDVASLGNHEFDEGVSGLGNYLRTAFYPIVAANLNVSLEPALQDTLQLRRSVVLRARDRKIGIIGYVTTNIRAELAGNLKLSDEIAAVRTEAKILKSQGCDIIVGLGHSGYKKDKQIAYEVEDIDLVIGGHTNTFLYSGQRPDAEIPAGPYPTVVVQPNGRKVYVVQAFAYTKYLGDLSVDFDAKGEIVRIQGKPILMDSSIPMAMDVKTELEIWKNPLKPLTRNVVGHTKVVLNGDETVCRLVECNMGNLLTDAMIQYNVEKRKVKNGWTDAAVAIFYAGGIRGSIGSLYNDEITLADILTAIPNRDIIYKVEVPAKVLIKALEWSLNDRIERNRTDKGGSFLQVSGLKIVYNLTEPVGSRVVNVKVRCSRCTTPIYENIDTDASYKLLIPRTVYHGAYGFTMFKELRHQRLRPTLIDMALSFIKKRSPLHYNVEGRIKLVV